MSASEAPELRAFRELEMLVRHLGEELAVFRRRAIAAEAQLKDGMGSAAGGHEKTKGRTAALGEQLADLEGENRSLKIRVESAEERVRQLMDRLRFLRQQVQTQTPAATSSR